MPRKLCFLKGHMTITHTFVCCKFLRPHSVYRWSVSIEKEKRLIAGIVSLMIGPFQNDNYLSGCDCVPVSSYLNLPLTVNAAESV